MVYNVQIFFQRLTETSLIHDINGKVMTAMYVFSASIKYMHDHLLKELKNQDGEIQEEEIHWVLTVPAIWDDSAKQFMRDAAEQVLNYNIHFVEVKNSFTFVFQIII